MRLGGACTSCAMSAMTLKQGIENTNNARYSRLQRCNSSPMMDFDEQLEESHFVFTERKCRVCGKVKN